MLNSFSKSYAEASVENNIKIDNESNSYSPIVRNNEKSKFKQVEIGSNVYDAILSSTPCILIDYKKNEEDLLDENKGKIEVFYKIQEIEVISLNQISQNNIIIEYIEKDISYINIEVSKKWDSYWSYDNGKMMYKYFEPTDKKIMETFYENIDKEKYK